jgi:hypothetical protein
MWGAGFATGIGVGFAIGIIVGSLTAKQKSWSELTEKEKKTRIWLIATGIIMLIAGIVAFLLLR